MNIDALKKNLESLNVDALNAILDERDGETFEKEWVKADESIPEGEAYPQDKEVFILLSNATGQHEICSYISDDLNLLHRAKVAGICSPFLNYLKQCYDEGTVPREWAS